MGFKPIEQPSDSSFQGANGSCRLSWSPGFPNRMNKLMSEKQKIIDENPEIMQIWDDETGDRMTSLCIIGRHMDKDALIASLDACLTDWHRA